MSTPFLDPIKKKFLTRRVIIGAIVALVAILVVFLMFRSFTRPALPYKLTDYEEAIKDGNRAHVFEIYNSTRLKHSELGAKPTSDATKKLLMEAEEIIQRIETDVKNRSEALLNRTFSGVSLTDDDVAQIELDAAISGNEMTRLIEDKTHLYLFGDVDENRYLSFLREIARVPIFSREYNQVLAKTDILQKVREKLAMANEAARQKAFYYEAEHIRKLLADRELTSIDHVTMYLEDRMAKVRQSYLDEQLPKIKSDVEHHKTYDASLMIKKIIVWFPDHADLLKYQAICDEKNPKTIANWVYPVEHIAIKPLIADDKRAFDGDRFAASADRELLLMSEFSSILEKLYERGYVLVDGRSFVTLDGKARAVPYPEGKKPICLVLDDFYLSEARVESGVAARLDLDTEGRLVGVVRDKDGTERVDRKFTAIGILEDFIEKHPDFSFNGATGTISIVGMNGLFGYPLTSEQDTHWRDEAKSYGIDNLDTIETDLERNETKVKAILSTLAARNWVIASGSYSRLSMDHASLQAIKSDMDKMEQIIEPITGKLSVLHYPYGLHAQFDNKKTSLFVEHGYTLLSGYGKTVYSNEGDGFVYVSKTLLSGRSLRQAREYGIERFFKAGEILDRANRP